MPETATIKEAFEARAKATGMTCLIDCKDLDEAIEVASQIPGARTGTIEVRPIWELEV